jgi:hypothetical protein
MAIERILKQLTPDRTKKEVGAIQNTKLPAKLQEWTKAYHTVGRRPEFLWKWAYRVGQLIIFPGVPSKYHQSLIETKFFLIMFIVLLDDAADNMQNRKLLDEILKVPFRADFIDLNRLNKEERKYLKFTEKVWQAIAENLKNYPYYKKLQPIISYDFEQILNGMNYAYLVNRNHYLINEDEFRIYLSYNTPATISYMIDLTCLPNLKMEFLGLIRSIAWRAQIMTRIANWVATWEREVRENDFTSGVFAYALRNNAISFELLQNSKEKNIYKIINKIKKSKAEAYFLKEWEKLYNEINSLVKILNKKDKSLNAPRLLQTIKKLTLLHLINKKFI